MSHDFTAAVERGATVLDNTIPNWEDGVDLGRLEMDNAYLCILGQVFGLYDRGMTALFGSHSLTSEEAEDMAVSCGFEAPLMRKDYIREYHQLTGAWVDFLTERRG